MFHGDLKYLERLCFLGGFLEGWRGNEVVGRGRAEGGERRKMHRT